MKFPQPHLVVILFSVLLLSFNATAPALEKIYANKVEILIPKEFKPMSDQMARSKYPSSNRPNLIYTDEDGAVNVAFNHTQNKATQAQMDAYKQSLVSSLKKSYPAAKWKEDGVKQINGRKVGYAEFVTPAIDQEVYNLMFFTDLDGKLLLCTFNCTTKQLGNWQTSAKQIMNSLTVK